MKDIMRVITSLEKRGILLKGTTGNVTSQKGGLLKRIGLPLLKNVLTLLAKSLLMPSGLTVRKNAAIQQKIYGSHMTLLIISNKEIKDIMEIV